jgi:A/G-specific adenine glycosylase
MGSGFSVATIDLTPQELSGRFVYWRKRLQDWYADNHRTLPWRKTLEPYSIWVSEVMLQQTRVNTVIAYHDRFLKRFPTIHSLARADRQDVLKLWEGLGYYSRARNFHKAAILVCSRHSGQIPDDWNAFRQLPGVGDYIASAVLSIAFNQPFAVVDGNVKRVISRLFAMDTPVNGSGAHVVFQEPATALLDRDAPGIFNQAMMELGALICKPTKPDCTLCPLDSFCAAFASSQVDVYPKRVKALPVPLYPVVAGVVFHQGRMLITQRKPDGLLGGLWEFPGGKIQEGESPADACVREILEETGVSAKVVSHLCQVKHAYTHFKIQMQVFICNAHSGAVRLSGPVDFRWITPDDIDLYPFPGANHKFIGLLRDTEPKSHQSPPTERTWI